MSPCFEVIPFSTPASIRWRRGGTRSAGGPRGSPSPSYPDVWDAPRKAVRSGAGDAPSTAATLLRTNVKTRRHVVLNAMDRTGTYTVVKPCNDHGTTTLREHPRNGTVHVVEYDDPAVEDALSNLDIGSVVRVELRRTGRRGTRGVPSPHSRSTRSEAGWSRGSLFKRHRSARGRSRVPPRTPP